MFEVRFSYLIALMLGEYEMTIENIFDAIQLSGNAPGIGDTLSTFDSDLVSVSDPLTFDVQTEGEIHPGDTVGINGIHYAVTGVTSYNVDATLQDGTVVATKMYSISLVDPDGNTLDFLVNADAEATETDGDLSQITQLDITGPSPLPDGYAIIPLIDENDDVTLADNDNTDPVATDDAATTDEDTPVTIDVLGNDTDPEGDPLSIVGTPTALHGTVTVNADGTLVYTPDADYNGEDTISYEITDGNGGTDTAEVAVTIDPVNDAPVAVDDADTTPFETPVVVNVLGNDTDPDGDTLSIVGTPTSDDGTVAVNADGTITFTPNDGFTGDATINYEITDGNGGNDTAVVTVTVADTPLDGIVSGTDGADLIDVNYDGDPEGDRVDNDDEIIAGEGPNDDIIQAGGGDDVVIAGLGDDDVYGGTGNDELTGGEGDDILRGEDGDDTLDGGGGDDTLLGGAGNDDIGGGDGNDTVDGGDGDDIIDTSGSDPLPDLAYPGLYEADDDPFDDRDVVNGGAGDDTITTGDDVDIIDGGTGNDTIDAGIDDDIIDGGEGNDYIIGGEGNDEIDGGTGNDTIYGGAGPDVPDAINIPDDGSGPFGPDLVPNNGMDVIHGGDGDDIIYGEDDDDTLFGDAGNDTLYGGIDDDTMDGGTGNDTLSGGQGNDTMLGGDDRDTFIDVTAGDTIDGGEGGDDFDTLDLTGSRPEGGTIRVIYDADNPENGHVNFRDEDGNVIGTTNFTNIENVIPCFVSGTRIKTTAGEVAVDNLEVGQLVQTMDHGLQPIRWIGSAKRAAVGDLAPIRIRKGALGNDRDLWVSPQHRMLMSGPQTEMMFGESEVLATAKSLLNDHTITRVEGGEVEYFHILFDSHEIVYAEGAPSESFHPGEQGWKALDQATRDEILELFPELASSDFNAYGPSARMSLKAHEAAILKTR